MHDGNPERIYGSDRIHTPRAHPGMSTTQENGVGKYPPRPLDHSRTALRFGLWRIYYFSSIIRIPPQEPHPNESEASPGRPFSRNANGNVLAADDINGVVGVVGVFLDGVRRA